MAHLHRHLGMGHPPGGLRPSSSRSLTSPDLVPPSHAAYAGGSQLYMPYDFHPVLSPNPSHRNEHGGGLDPHFQSLKARFAQLELHQRQSDEEIRQLRDRNRVLEAQLVAVSAVPAVPEAYIEDSGDDADTEISHLETLATVTATRSGRIPATGANATSVPALSPPVMTQSSASAQAASPLANHTKPAALPSLGLPFKSLTIGQQRVRRQLTSMVSTTFRSLCGVSAKTPWPDPSIERTDPITNEHVFTPNFPGGLADPYNIKIFDAVAMTVLKQIQDPARRPIDLETCGARVDYNDLRAFAKESFKGFNKHYKAQIDEKAQQRINQSNAKDRETQRRRLKLKQRLSAADKYAAAHNLDRDDVAATLDLEHMSDEPSGPEDSDKDKGEWALEMAHASGRRDATPQSIADLTFIQVCEFDWRTDEATNLNLELSQIHEDSLSNSNRDRRRLIRVRNTGRLSTRFPAKAPFNFAIRADWLAEKKKDEAMVEMLETAGWGDFLGPKGFDCDSDNNGVDNGLTSD
ncbi:unnamed protein product [Mycena citricolor]|uniref:Uncharacterized protein n=1 Tax=Mycena citricolor TaxID=2018698 RepID=A0AAD2K0D8_9AGAR|nr:unnamed protein product [Mycena citricolor]